MDKIEFLVLNNLINNEEYLRKTVPFLKEEYFEDHNQRVVFQEIAKFVDEYNDVPTKEVLSIEVEKRKDINEDPRDTIPHVLILDEINRTDLSKLFGEVFSALEKRGEEFDLSIKGETLNVPENLYIIGTMNEIDFSLEQIDFALRRRFLWYFYGFNEDTLRKIINEKSKKSPLGSDTKQAELEIFINNVSKLNEAISKSPVLGDQFQIGHTFFVELVDIYNSFISIEGKKTPKIYYSTKDKNRDEGPAFVLWTISIEPMLNAFLGNLDEDEKNDVIGKFKEIYMGNGAE